MEVHQQPHQGHSLGGAIGQLLGWLAITFGLLAALVYQAFSGFWIAAIGWFALRNAAAYNQVTNLQEAMLALTTADAMTRDFRVVDADISLRQFADTYLLDENRAPAYFAASDGRYRGLVGVDDMRAIERSQWETLPLHHIAKPLLDIPSVREDAPLTEVVEQLEARQLSRLTVLTPADAVAGTVDRGDVVRAIADHLGLRISSAMIQRIKDDGQYPPGLQLPSIAKSVIEEAGA